MERFMNNSKEKGFPAARGGSFMDLWLHYSLFETKSKDEFHEIGRERQVFVSWHNPKHSLLCNTEKSAFHKKYP